MSRTTFTAQVRGNNVRKRLALEEDNVSPVPIEDAGEKSGGLEPGSIGKHPKAHIKEADGVVFFFAYQFYHVSTEPYCGGCFYEIVGDISDEEEVKYITTGEKPLSEWTEKDANDRYNHCCKCKIPLYKFEKHETKLQQYAEKGVKLYVPFIK